MMHIPEWHELAVCRTVDPDLWWPDKSESNTPAKAICRTCPVVAQCLQHALDAPEVDGIWGGRSARERARMRRTERKKLGGVYCTICGHLFPGGPHHLYCSQACGLEGRRRIARKRYAAS